MKKVRRFPYGTETIEHVPIKMTDGCILSARLWLPDMAGTQPVPAIVEYIPYRKRDLTRLRDSVNHPYLAGHGYACLRVDLRGSGESQGLLTDQYRPIELKDGYEIIEWAASQKWCNGSVGMMGISWGGFNALQVAALAPPSLKAIISICATDDLYQDNMHYMGGCLLSDNLSEATTMFSVNSSPPDPLIMGDLWRKEWLARLEHNRPWLKTWLSHQKRDDYWKQGSVCENYQAIQCPVFLAGGWADGFTNSIFRLLQHLSVPRKALIGPWGHKYPHMGVPGPATGFLQEARRWWDHWLKGQPNHIMDEPMLRVWMQDTIPPKSSYADRPGKWIGERQWPSPRIKNRRLRLAPHRLDFQDNTTPEKILSVQSPMSLGMFAGKWCSYQATPDLPYDQREEDGGALVFETPVLESDIEIFGLPEAELLISANQPDAMVAVRLSNVYPDGRATRITYGVFNLTHHRGHQSPEALIPGAWYRVRIGMNGIAQIFPRGHRIRLSVSSSYWPLCWLPPKPVTLKINTAESMLHIPVRPSDVSDSLILPPEKPEGAWPLEIETAKEKEMNWRLYRDMALDKSMLEVIKDEGTWRIPEIDLTLSHRVRETYSIRAEDYDSIEGKALAERTFERKDWKIWTSARMYLTSDENYFYLEAELDAAENNHLIFSRKWNHALARDRV